MTSAADGASEQVLAPADCDVVVPPHNARLALRRRILKRSGIAVVAVFIIAGGLVAADRATSGPEACEPCHEMAPRIEQWRQSGHSRIACADCHTGPTDRYELPRSIASNVALLGRDTLKHAKGDYQDPVETLPRGATPIQDEVCLHCHHLGRTITPREGVLINHAEHAQRNNSCVSCHIRTGHPLPSRGKELTLMSQCFTCHGSSKTAKAPATCTVCHPKGFEYRPRSHLAGVWTPSHGTVALGDRKQCAMCHEQGYCDECHGLEIPHPPTWPKGDDSHAAYVKRDRSVCARCHEGTVNLCTACHHQDFGAEKGTWLEQHPASVELRGTGSCLSCHSPLFCTRCHATRDAR